jgi:hypothetical protein
MGDDTSWRYEARSHANGDLDPPITTPNDGPSRTARYRRAIAMAEWYWGSADAEMGARGTSVEGGAHVPWSSCDSEFIDSHDGYCGECQSCTIHGRLSSGRVGRLRRVAIGRRAAMEAALVAQTTRDRVILRVQFEPRRWSVSDPRKAKKNQDPMSPGAMLAGKLRIEGITQPLVGLAALTPSARAAWRTDEAKRGRGGEGNDALLPVVRVLEDYAARSQGAFLASVLEEAWDMLEPPLERLGEELRRLEADAELRKEEAKVARRRHVDALLAGDQRLQSSVRLRGGGARG